MRTFPRIIAIIQARMGSKRLPGKVLIEIEGYPILWHVVKRVSLARTIQKVIVATSTDPQDNAIVNFCAKNGIECFRGSEWDVLDRFYQAAKRYQADAIVRITGDCPLIDPQIIDKVVNAYCEGDYDYVSNTLYYTYPDGLDTEIFSFATLKAAWQEATLLSDREHVTPYIIRSGRFRCYNVESEIDISSRALRFTVDEPADLAFVRAIYSRFFSEKRDFTFHDVLNLLDKEPSLQEINTGIIRNEGYYRSLINEAPIPPKKIELNRSQELKSRAYKLIPSCTQTFSKGPIQFVQGVAPVFLQCGKGSHVWDVDGNEYIDYPMALGPIILGYDYPMVNERVIRQIQEGSTFSLPHPLEVETAELLTEVIPCAEMVRFGKNGSDATSGAIRLSRAYTGRNIIACCGYHGWQDWYIGTTTRDKGVPKAVQELTIPFEYNNIDSLKYIFAEHPGEVAAVIMEPLGMFEPCNGFLHQVQELTRKEGALLIFDEVVTGFRIALGGAQEYYGVTPDLACFGKAMANGYPLSAVVGKKEIMRLFDEVFFSFTFGGETVSLAAAVATITEMREKNVIAHLWEQGKKLKDGYLVLAHAFGIECYTRCLGLPPHTVITFEDETGTESYLLLSLFQQECLKRGVLFNGCQNISYSHSNEDIEYTLRVFRTVLEILAQAIKEGSVAQRLEGDPIKPIFRLR